MKSARLLALVLIVVAGFIVLTSQNEAFAQAQDKDATKGPWIIHSMAGGDTIVTGNPVCTHWVQIYLGPLGTCWNKYHCYRWADNGDNWLSPCDTLYMHMYWPYEAYYWMHVEEVTKTLRLKYDESHQPQPSPPPGLDSMYAEFTWGWSHFQDQWEDSLDRNPIGKILEVVWPSNYYQYRFHLNSWIDTDGGGTLSPCDTIDMIDEQTGDTTWWHVEAVKTDVKIDAHGRIRQQPTLTQWGAIILVALLIASAVFIMLRRRKATMPA